MAPATTWKLLAGAFGLIVLVGLMMLARDRTGTPQTGLADGNRNGEVRSLGTGSRGHLPASENEVPDTQGGETYEVSTSPTLVADSDSAAGQRSEDVLATGTEAIDAEDAETRERERYEIAQRSAYQFRKTDPGKILPTPVMPALADAAQKYNVPQEILLALMAVESGGAHRDADHSMEGGFGVMNLKENNLIDTLGEASSLIGRTKEEVLYDQKLNIEAATALLARYYEDALAAGLVASEAWYMALSQYSGRPNPELAAALADEVGGMMMRGFETELNDGGGRVTLPANPNPPFYPKNWKLAGVTPPPTMNSNQSGGGTPPPSAGGNSLAEGGSASPPAQP